MIDETDYIADAAEARAIDVCHRASVDRERSIDGVAKCELIIV